MTHLVQLNDALLDLDDPALLGVTSYGHFTSMQVRGCRVRGLELHLERLDRSSRELFGHGVAADRILTYLRTALARSASGDVSIRVTAFSRDRALIDGTPVEPDLLITVTDPIEPTAQPPRLLAVEHERAAPHLKHTGTFSLTHEIRRARLAGYDDALFHDRAGHVSEASIWNICFATQDRIVWPAAAALPGITMLTLQAGLDALTVARETVDIPLTAIAGYDAAYLTNSIDPALPVASITNSSGTTRYRPDPRSAELLRRAYEAVPDQAI
ncbi:aminotransferase class IV [Streptomyces sp. SID13031]|uniref:aminotransferase class IV n=1 Tax=Streptomyces sp. SID13031 TaxID=2706046 RepID=UPI0013CB6D1D|nr:aminodeoxychorismate lyase [Streptomyces sp. SID13031]